MSRLRMWRLIDAVAHVLYCPTMLGRRHAHSRWHHEVHLIPGSVLARVCGRLDRVWTKGAGRGDR